jgi:glutamyl-tRNA synthetase
LDNLNKHYIKEKTEDNLFDLISPLLQKKYELTPVLVDNEPLQQEGKIFAAIEKNKIIRALKFIKERAVKINDLAESGQIYIDGFIKNLDEKDLEIIKNNLIILTELKEVIEKIDIWNHDGIKETINNFATTKNLKIKDFGPALRIALTFSSASAGGLFDVVEILGKTESIRRINLLVI